MVCSKGLEKLLENLWYCSRKVILPFMAGIFAFGNFCSLTEELGLRKDQSLYRTIRTSFSVLTVVYVIACFALASWGVIVFLANSKKSQS